MPDTFKVYDILKEAQIPEPQARAIARAIHDADQAVTSDLRAFIDKKLENYPTKDFLSAKLSDFKAELMRWMFVFWVGQMAATVGIIFGAFKLLR